MQANSDPEQLLNRSKEKYIFSECEINKKCRSIEFRCYEPELLGTAYGTNKLNAILFGLILS